MRTLIALAALTAASATAAASAPGGNFKAETTPTPVPFPMNPLGLSSDFGVKMFVPCDSGGGDITIPAASIKTAG